MPLTHTPFLACEQSDKQHRPYKSNTGETIHSYLLEFTALFKALFQPRDGARDYCIVGNKAVLHSNSRETKKKRKICVNSSQ